MTKKNRQLVVGVLGGMGPEATIDFMNKVMTETPADSDQDHIQMLVHQNPKVPNRQEAILRNGSSPGPMLGKMAAALQRAGADFLVMPCNSAQAFESDILAEITIPLLSIVSVSVSAAISLKAKAAGILATDGCLASGIFQRELRNREIECVIPTDNEIKVFMKLIGSIKSGQKDPHLRVDMQDLAQNLVSRGADVIIAGCTEIPLVLRDGDVSVSLISSTDELAKKTVSIALGRSEFPS